MNMDKYLFEQDRQQHPVRYIRSLVSLGASVFFLFAGAGAMMMAINAYAFGLDTKSGQNKRRESCSFEIVKVSTPRAIPKPSIDRMQGA